MQQQAGQQAFLRNGCGACHAVRGTPARGTVGPDLTHVGSRLELAAGTLPNDAAAFERWISATHAVKPGVLMPPFAALAEAQLHRRWRGTCTACNEHRAAHARRY